MRRPRTRISRRAALKDGAAIVGGAMLGTTAAAAQVSAPAVQTRTSTGRLFRGLVRHGTGLTVEDLRLRAIQPRQVVIRSQAVAPCCTVVWGGALGTNQSRRAYVPNHCGFGVVDEIGPDVKRVQVGDRVIVAGTSDRKSTRLNSSHSQISYAVFCLKKKKKQQYRKTGSQSHRKTRARSTRW